MMAGLDASKSVKILKGDPRTAHSPVIMVTALSDVADRVRGRQAGADISCRSRCANVPLFARVRSLIRLKPADGCLAVRRGRLEPVVGRVTPQPLAHRMRTPPRATSW